MSADYMQMFKSEAKRAGSNDRGAALVLVDSIERKNLPRAHVALACIKRQRLKALGLWLIQQEEARCAVSDCIRDGLGDRPAT